jgi:hypothetical protein
MKRRYVLALVVTALLCLALVWGARSRGAYPPAAVPKVALRAPPRPKLPTRTEPAPVPVRDEAAAGAGNGVVRCTLDDAWLDRHPEFGAPAMWQMFAAAPPSPEPTPSHNGSFPEVTVPAGDWRVTIIGEDRIVLSFSASVGRGEVVSCAVGPRRVDVRVGDLTGNPVSGTRVWGCGTSGETDESGRAVLLVEGADCDVQARFRDGALSRFAVAHLLMGDRELALDLDTRPVAGLGVPFRVGDDGVTIGAPMPGSPASAAGLVEGDVLVEVDGTGVAGVEPYDFVNLATGVEGTTVTLQVRGADGGERTVRLVRARISADDEAGD